MSANLDDFDIHPAAKVELGDFELHGSAPGVPTSTPSDASSALKGLGQGLTFGFGDELGAAEQAALTKLTGRGDFGDTYLKAREESRAENEAAKSAHPLAYYPGEIAGGAVTSFLPGVGLSRGAKLGGTVLKTALAGGLAGLGNSTADLTQGDVAGAAKDTGVGTVLGGTLGAAGAGLGRLGQRAAQGVANVDQAVARKAAQTAAGETASARSAAGQAAQDAYRQLEHLRDLKAMGQLTPAEAQTASKLEQELASKAQAKLLPAAARKAETSTAYSDAMTSEPGRASAEAERLLGWDRLKQVVGPRLLRYGLPALGGAMGLGHGHGAAGMAVGALAGAGMRPMMHSLIRGAADPVVQRPLLRAASAVLNGTVGAAPVVERMAGTESRALAPAATAVVDPRLQALIAALRGQPNTQQEVANASQ